VVLHCHKADSGQHDMRVLSKRSAKITTEVKPLQKGAQSRIEAQPAHVRVGTMGKAVGSAVPACIMVGIMH
jgi:hypothetical protein